MGHQTRRTALITGASRGLGLALARRLAGEGWGLILDARGKGALDAVADELTRSTEVIAVVGDVADPDHRRALAGAARDAGGLDAVVNNASALGPSPRPGLLDYPTEALEEVYRTNAISPLALLQDVRDFLKAGARIVNVTSDAAVESYKGWGGYGSSKAALEQLSNILAAENPNLRVYTVDPGDMRTRMHQEAFPGEDISDRPPPEKSVPGLVFLLTEDLPSGRYAARDLAGSGEPESDEPAKGIRELRVALTVDNFDGAVALYKDGLGLPVVTGWDGPDGRGLVLAAGPSTIEILDKRQAGFVDGIEVGGRVSGPVRLALEVADIDASAATLREKGADVLGDGVETPWGDLNRRLRDPDGLQLTLFQANQTATAGGEAGRVV